MSSRSVPVRPLALAAAAATALALVAISAPPAHAAPAVTLATDADWQDVIDAANSGATVDAVSRTASP